MGLDRYCLFFSQSGLFFALKRSDSGPLISLLSCKINLSDPLSVHFYKVTQTQSEGNQSPGVKASVQMKESQGLWLPQGRFWAIRNPNLDLGHRRENFGVLETKSGLGSSARKPLANPDGASQSGVCWLPKELKAVFVGEF